MFFKLILENANGDRVNMTATANQYMTSRAEGTNPSARICDRLTAHSTASRGEM